MRSASSRSWSANTCTSVAVCSVSINPFQCSSKHRTGTRHFWVRIRLGPAGLSTPPTSRRWSPLVFPPISASALGDQSQTGEAAGCYQPGPEARAVEGCDSALASLFRALGVSDSLDKVFEEGDDHGSLVVAELAGGGVDGLEVGLELGLSVLPGLIGERDDDLAAVVRMLMTAGPSELFEPVDERGDRS